VNRRRGGRNGVSTRVATDLAGRLRDIRALWLAVHNHPARSIEDQAAEFYVAVGGIFEGKTLAALPLQKIDRARVLAHAEE